MLDATPLPARLSALHRVVLRWGLLRSALAAAGALCSLVLGGLMLFSALAGHELAPATSTLAVVLSVLLAPLLAWLTLRLAQAEAARLALAAQAREADGSGVPARSHFQRAAEREFARCRRYGEDAAVLLIAADHFRAIGLQHGSAAAESVLTAVALKARSGLRQPDLVARYGMEELVVFLPHTDPLGALDVAERIREAAATTRLRRQGHEMMSTVSIGVASMGAGHDALDVLTHDADIALLEAKQAGRNCVRAAPIQPRASEHQQLESPR
ncbi:diguanylate cyclase (GGDEF) domain-containing protein [Burkholderiales bacterium JOSHI_001]|nr:diguanylate cyclase (GGDEF) domain-containing protein [Burkholderiales bacterium JOSHI_001]